MLIAHLSDFHVFSGAAETSLVRPDAADAARKVVAAVVDFAPKIDAVMLTGDLTDGGSPADYALLKDILAPIDVPIFCVPGNHDKRDAMRQAFPHLPYARAESFTYETRLGDIRIIGLDTLLDGRIEGRLDAGQLEWLGEKLARPSDGLTIILMHHPAFPSFSLPLDRMALVEGRTRFGELVKAYRGPLRILSGHIHRPFQALWNGAFCAVGGGPAFQHRLELRPDAPEPGPINEPYAFYLHRLEGTGTVTVHTRYVSL
jgi:Icc protein